MKLLSRDKLPIKVYLLLFNMMFFYINSAHATVNGPSISDTNNFQITWTNTAQSCGGTYCYYIKEYREGAYTKTYYVYYYPSTKYLNLNLSNSGLYTYEVFYRYGSTPSGSTFLAAGSKDVQVLNSADANRDIKFIHTDLLGTPVAASDIDGDLK